MRNLDHLNQDALLSFWLKYRQCSVQEAQELIGDTKPGATKVAALLASFAFAKHHAIQCKAKGKLKEAAAYERSCDVYYGMVPPGLKWDRNTSKPHSEKKHEEVRLKKREEARPSKKKHTKPTKKQPPPKAPPESQPVLKTKPPVCLGDPKCYGEFFVMHFTDGPSVQCRRRRDLIRRAAKRGKTYTDVLPVEHVPECPCHGQTRHVSDVVGPPDQQQEETKVL